jgi:DNA invertase Pin-like site-specific DNA recombinase
MWWAEALALSLLMFARCRIWLLCDPVGAVAAGALAAGGAPPEIDSGGPMGRMVLSVLGMVAEMEFRFIRDRQRAGIDAAKAKGVYKGRPPTFDRARIVTLRKEGMGATEIARAVGCKRGNVYKAFKAARLN